MEGRLDIQLLSVTLAQNEGKFKCLKLCTKARFFRCDPGLFAKGKEVNTGSFRSVARGYGPPVELTTACVG